MNNTNLLRAINLQETIKTLTSLYGCENLASQQKRYITAINEYCDYFDGNDDLMVFSAPGRTEIGGNHTDHNLGKVLAASVNLDVIAIVSFNQSDVVRVKSVGYDEDIININELEKLESEQGKSCGIVRGILARFAQLGYKIGGFNAYTTSDVLKGCGISSSAAFEVLIGTILNHGYNNSTISSVDIAKISQYSEREYFGKPCGLMDQMASSVGGIISIDFANEDNPIIEKVDFNIKESGYALCIVDTGSNHADLTDEYAAIPAEMKNIALYFGESNLRKICKKDVIDNIIKLKKLFGDRAVLRALHFFDENERVDKEVTALKNNDITEFNKQVIASGNSSYKYLQNVYSAKAFDNQGLSLALYIAESELANNGAYRVHGGGFGGTMQNFVPIAQLDDFKKKIESAFSSNSCHVLNIRPVGGIKII